MHPQAARLVPHRRTQPRGTAKPALTCGDGSYPQFPPHLLTLLTSTMIRSFVNITRAPTWGQPPTRPGRPGEPTSSVRRLPTAAGAWQDAHPGIQDSAHAPRLDQRDQWRTPVKFTRRTRRARRRRRLGGAQPAGPAERPGARRPADRDRSRAATAWCCRRSTTRPPPGRRCPPRSQDEGKALVSGRLLADICRSLPNKPVEMTIDGSKVSLTCGSARFSLQTMPVEEYPTLPDMPQATGTVAQRPVRQRRRPGGHGRRPRRHAAGAHRRPDRDRGLGDLAAGHRPLPALACASCHGSPGPPTSRPPPWCPPRCSPTPPSR